MDPKAPEARALLKPQGAIFDDEGSDSALFDYHGVHRGGFVRFGARHMLQCRLSPVDPEGPAARPRRIEKGRRALDGSWRRRPTRAKPTHRGEAACLMQVHTR